MTRQNPADLIRGGKLPEKPYPVCTEPDLLVEHAELVKLRDTAEEVGSATTEFDEQIAGALKRIEAATVTLQLRALARRKWKDLKDEHQPRKDAEGNIIPEDRRLQVHEAPFFDALVRQSIIAPELDDETVTVLIDEKLTDGQWEELTTICWNLNESRISVPFSSAASTNRRSTSKR